MCQYLIRLVHFSMWEKIRLYRVNKRLNLERYDSRNKRIFGKAFSFRQTLSEKKIVGTKDNIEKKVLDYMDARMNDKSMIRVIKFSVSIKSGKYTAYDWTYKPTYR